MRRMLTKKDITILYRHELNIRYNHSATIYGDYHITFLSTKSKPIKNNQDFKEYIDDELTIYNKVYLEVWEGYAKLSAKTTDLTINKSTDNPPISILSFFTIKNSAVESV